MGRRRNLIGSVGTDIIQALEPIHLQVDGEWYETPEGMTLYGTFDLSIYNKLKDRIEKYGQDNGDVYILDNISQYEIYVYVKNYLMEEGYCYLTRGQVVLLSDSADVRLSRYGNFSATLYV